jgi:hypothetical protein
MQAQNLNTTTATRYNAVTNNLSRTTSAASNAIPGASPLLHPIQTSSASTNDHRNRQPFEIIPEPSISQSTTFVSLANNDLETSHSKGQS